MTRTARLAVLPYGLIVGWVSLQQASPDLVAHLPDNGRAILFAALSAIAIATAAASVMLVTGLTGFTERLAHAQDLPKTITPTASAIVLTSLAAHAIGLLLIHAGQSQVVLVALMAPAALTVVRIMRAGDGVLRRALGGVPLIVWLALDALLLTSLT